MLSEVHDASHISLNDKNSAWSLYLECADGRTLAPSMIKEVDLGAGDTFFIWASF